MRTILIPSTDSPVAPLPSVNSQASSQGKTLIYQDNNCQDNAQTTSSYARQSLKRAGLDSKYLRTLQVIYTLYKLI